LACGEPKENPATIFIIMRILLLLPPLIVSVTQIAALVSTTTRKIRFQTASMVESLRKRKAALENDIARARGELNKHVRGLSIILQRICITQCVPRIPCRPTTRPNGLMNWLGGRRN
jgi:hypothetical protein